ncbi:MAG: hypothetical protein ACFB4J_16215 [Elainellaceae cyanobacterium]
MIEVLLEGSAVVAQPQSRRYSRDCTEVCASDVGGETAGVDDDTSGVGGETFEDSGET